MSAQGWAMSNEVSGAGPPGVKERGAEPPMLVGVTDVCALLSIGRTKLFELVRDGELPVHHIGRRTLFARCEVEAFVARLIGGAP